MKQIQKPANIRLTPFRKLAVAACLVTTLGCGAANERVIPDYWGARHTEISHSKGRLTNLFREKTVDIAGTKVSFVIPNDTISDLDLATKRYSEKTHREDAFFIRYLSIPNIPFGFKNGKNQWSNLTTSYAIEKGGHMVAIAFNEELDLNPTIEGHAGIRRARINDLATLLNKLGSGEIRDMNMVAETIGMPTTFFGIPLDSKNQPMGNGPWGQLAIGASFNPSTRKLVAWPIVIVAEGKTREESREALVQRLGSP